MTQRKAVAVAVAVAVVAVLVGVCGCGGGKEKFRLRELGFSMELPPGWGQGQPRSTGGWRTSSGSMYFFADAKADDPSGSVLDYPFDEDTLAEYVDKAVKQTMALNSMFSSLVGVAGRLAGEGDSQEVKEAQESLETKLISKTPLAIGKLEAFEVIIESPDFAILEVYILHKDNVIYLTFRAPRKNWPKIKPLIQEAVKTIKIR